MPDVIDELMELENKCARARRKTCTLRFNSLGGETRKGEGGKRVNVCGTLCGRNGQHPGRTINFLSVSPISAGTRLVIFAQIRTRRRVLSFVEPEFDEFCRWSSQDSTTCRRELRVGVKYTYRSSLKSTVGRLTQSLAVVGRFVPHRESFGGGR